MTGRECRIDEDTFIRAKINELYHPLIGKT